MKCAKILFSSLWLIGSSSLFAKVGLVNMQKVILTVAEGKAAREALEKEIKGKEKELVEKRSTLETMQKEWKDKGALLSEEARFKKQEEFQQKFMEVRDMEMSFQNQIKQKEMEATQRIAINVQKIVETLAKEEGLDIVHETSSSGLLYVKDPVDLTDKVIASYDKQKSSKPGQAVMDLSKNTKTAPENAKK
jgi:outer membrane protein